MYTIIGSERSPFVRACRMLMTANKIPFQFEVLNFVDDENAVKTLEQESPINRVPILVSGKQKIFDSRVIANFLIQKHGLKALSLDEENILSSIYSCLDTGVLQFLLKREGIDMNRDGFFFVRNQARIPANLQWLKPWVESLSPEGDWNYPAMAMYSFLYWGEKRVGLDFTSYPEMRAFIQRFAKAPGVQETAF
jgi:glutathione S-transferase